jgi:hypothetical protein
LIGDVILDPRARTHQAHIKNQQSSFINHQSIRRGGSQRTRQPFPCQMFIQWKKRVSRKAAKAQRKRV